jgi:hypothetical protein
VQWSAGMSSTRAFVLLEQCTPLLAIMALLAGALWLGVLFSVSWLSGRARLAADGAEMGHLAVSLNRIWAMPLLLVSSLSGAAWIWTHPAPLALPWLSGLGVVFLVLLGLHSIVARRATRVANGSLRATRGEGARRLALVVSMAALTSLVTLHVLAR